MPSRTPRLPVFIADRTVERRSVLEWIGKGAVIALGSPLLQACLGAARGADGEADAAADADGGPEAADGGADVPAGAFPFEPGSGTQPVFSGWGERTVDPQDPLSIIASWRLTVDGLVETPRTFTFAELIGLPRQDEVMDFHCVEGWDVLDVPWNGVHLSRIFELVHPLPAATYAAFHTIDDTYDESLPMSVALEPHIMLGYGVEESTLPLAHGFPLRVVAPRLLGYKNAKYVQRIELTDAPLLGYWVRAGYPYDGEVPPSRLRPGKY